MKLDQESEKVDLPPGSRFLAEPATLNEIEYSVEGNLHGDLLREVVVVSLQVFLVLLVPPIIAGQQRRHQRHAERHIVHPLLGGRRENLVLLEERLTGQRLAILLVDPTEHCVQHFHRFQRVVCRVDSSENLPDLGVTDRPKITDSDFVIQKRSLFSFRQVLVTWDRLVQEVGRPPNIIPQCRDPLLAIDQPLSPFDVLSIESSRGNENLRKRIPFQNSVYEKLLVGVGPDLPPLEVRTDFQSALLHVIDKVPNARVRNTHQFAFRKSSRHLVTMISWYASSRSQERYSRALISRISQVRRAVRPSKNSAHDLPSENLGRFGR